MGDRREQYSDDPEAGSAGIKAVYLMSDGDWCDCVRRVAAARDKEITRLRAELAECRRDAERYRDALVSIEERWNRDCNERAMHDACWHAVNTAQAALAAKE